ncbi:MAG: hypothetical protein II747_00110, partial [Clostridia bacterium]|nr:hypothetical protein [Clostridia bacterium]
CYYGNRREAASVLWTKKTRLPRLLSNGANVSGVSEHETHRLQKDSHHPLCNRATPKKNGMMLAASTAVQASSLLLKKAVSTKQEIVKAAFFRCLELCLTVRQISLIKWDMRFIRQAIPQ